MATATTTTTTATADDELPPLGTGCRTPATWRDGDPPNSKAEVVFGSEALMSQKAHGSSATPVQKHLRYGVSHKLADKICNFNRHFAEPSGYAMGTSWLKTVRKADAPTTYYDSNSGKPLFTAPIGRAMDEFVEESKKHGWPSFRDQEVHWDNVRVLKESGEVVSTAGTHLGHLIPDRHPQTGEKRNRYCINLVSVAGHPEEEAE